MDIVHEPAADRIVAHQPGHPVGWAMMAAGVLVIPAGLWALPIATSGHVAIAIGTVLLSALFLWLGVMGVTEVTATFDGAARSLTVRRQRLWHATTRAIPFSDIVSVSESRRRWLDADEHRFEIALADKRTVRMRYKPDEKEMVRAGAAAINRLVRR